MALLLDSAVPRLRVLTTEPLPPNPAEILGSARIRAVLAALGEEADILVLDSPPIPAVADSAILASQVDGGLLAIDVGLTRRDVALRALASLQQVKARVVGAVLNRVPQRRSHYYYYCSDYSTSDGSGRRSRRWRWPWQDASRQRVWEPIAAETLEE